MLFKLSRPPTLPTGLLLDFGLDDDLDLGALPLPDPDPEELDEEPPFDEEESFCTLELADEAFFELHEDLAMALLVAVESWLSVVSMQ